MCDVLISRVIHCNCLSFFTVFTFECPSVLLILPHTHTLEQTHELVSTYTHTHTHTHTHNHSHMAFYYYTVRFMREERLREGLERSRRQRLDLEAALLDRDSRALENR